MTLDRPLRTMNPRLRNRSTSISSFSPSRSKTYEQSQDGCFACQKKRKAHSPGSWLSITALRPNRQQASTSSSSYHPIVSSFSNLQFHPLNPAPSTNTLTCLFSPLRSPCHKSFRTLYTYSSFPLPSYPLTPPTAPQSPPPQTLPLPASTSNTYE